MNLNKKGFTLVELIIAIIIVSIITIVSVNYYQYSYEKARATEAVSILRTIADANIHYYLEYGSWCDNINLLPITIEGKNIVQGTNRIQGKNYIYSSRGNNGNEIAVAQRIPFATKYYIRLVTQNELSSKNLYKIEAGSYSTSTELDKRIANEINIKGTL